ncbi:hypothetical protein N7G274_005514 [Stereocaulon virgatum]|uniref:Uncharacterized protein n=1 Tax=Stereocaulon virgatum TaxID=373712 RepID=A0ABR4A9E8_9LECA
MEVEHILRIPRSDSEGDCVLVNAASKGKNLLDLKLLATEGEAPYVAEIKQSRISKLRDKRNKLSDADWEATLKSALCQRNPQYAHSKAENLEKLETIATIAGDSLALTFRHNISGITQKLGEIVFKKDENQEIDITSWASTAVLRANELESEVQDLTVKYDEQSKMIEKLNQQLEDLIQAKKAHEDALLEKFRELLNSKKLKIRDQQRLLAGAKVDPKQAVKIQNARETAKGHKPAPSRKGKRKAEVKAEESEAEDEESFEKAASPGRQEEDLSEQVDTPEASDQDVTEDESDDDLDAAPREAILPDRSKAVGGKLDKMQFDTPPPTRELPFGKADIGGGREHVKLREAGDKSMLNQEAGNEDEETDDDDDEL